MTDRERELETENRMLRDQVASLERIVEGLSRPAIQWNSLPGAAPQPTWQWYAPTWIPGITWCSTDTTASGSISGSD